MNSLAFPCEVFATLNKILLWVNQTWPEMRPQAVHCGPELWLQGKEMLLLFNRAELDINRTELDI